MMGIYNVLQRVKQNVKTERICDEDEMKVKKIIEEKWRLLAPVAVGTDLAVLNKRSRIEKRFEFRNENVP